LEKVKKMIYSVELSSLKLMKIPIVFIYPFLI